jgi:hypothetical protein
MRTSYLLAIDTENPGQRLAVAQGDREVTPDASKLHAGRRQRQALAIRFGHGEVGDVMEWPILHPPAEGFDVRQRLARKEFGVRFRHVSGCGSACYLAVDNPQPTESRVANFQRFVDDCVENRLKVSRRVIDYLEHF